MAKTFSPIRDQRLSDKVIEQLLESMRGGELPVGTHLPPESSLAEQLGVSRGILREALTVLEARGFIKRTPKEGTIVRSTSGDELGRALTEQLRKATYRDLLEFREVMECRAAEDAIENATDAELGALKELVDAPDKRSSEPEDAELDHYFHYRLAELSGNSLFAGYIDTYYELIREMKKRSLQNDSRRESVHAEHRAICEALCARDKRTAKRELRKHLDAVRRSLEGGA